jgi:hypothetical protein
VGVVVVVVVVVVEEEEEEGYSKTDTPSYGEEVPR